MNSLFFFVFFFRTEKQELVCVSVFKIKKNQIKSNKNRIKILLQLKNILICHMKAKRFVCSQEIDKLKITCTHNQFSTLIDLKNIDVDFFDFADIPILHKSKYTVCHRQTNLKKRLCYLEFDQHLNYEKEKIKQNKQKQKQNMYSFLICKLKTTAKLFDSLTEKRTK